MFDNIGGKIKGLVATLCWIGILAFCVFGLFLIVAFDFLTGLLVAAGGSFACWIGSFMLYGYGAMIENSEIMVELNKRMLRVMEDNARQLTPPTGYDPNIHNPNIYNPNVYNEPNPTTPAGNTTTQAGKEYRMRALNKMLKDGLITMEEYHKKIGELQ